MNDSLLNVPTIYWHLHEVHQKELDIASNLGVFIEIDIAWDYDLKKPYIGHPETFYTIVKKIPKPDNITLDMLEKFLIDNPVVGLVIDIKDSNAINYINGLVGRLENKIIIHAFIKEWAEPVPDFVEPEAHWQQENIPLEDIKRLDYKNVPIIGAVRGYSKDWLQNIAFNKILKQADGLFDSVSVYLPGANVPPQNLIDKIYNYGYFPWINIDMLPDVYKLPKIYIGMTDDPLKATKL